MLERLLGHSPSFLTPQDRAFFIPTAVGYLLVESPIVSAEPGDLYSPPSFVVDFLDFDEIVRDWIRPERSFAVLLGHRGGINVSSILCSFYLQQIFPHSFFLFQCARPVRRLAAFRVALF